MQNPHRVMTLRLVYVLINITFMQKSPIMENNSRNAVTLTRKNSIPFSQNFSWIILPEISYLNINM